MLFGFEGFQIQEAMNGEDLRKEESPQYLRMSLGAAMTLGFKQGVFYRNAKLYCINLLLTYEEGCIANCAYCGLSGKRSGEYDKKSFIRVAWPKYPLKDIIECILENQNKIKRICISMITQKRSVYDTKYLCNMLHSRINLPVSILVSPTVIGREDLEDFKSAGADKIGVAIDLATHVLFYKYRGSGVSGPHKWERYWDCLKEAIDIFGNENAGPHLIAGMGETEKQMCEAIQKSRDLGGRTHLFSFFPETGSMMENHEPPLMAHYRKIQIARYLIDEGKSRADQFAFNQYGQIKDFKISEYDYNNLIDSGEPFRTSGCKGNDGEVACNRPFANSRPGPDIRNYPFCPTINDIRRIRLQIGNTC